MLVPLFRGELVGTPALQGGPVDPAGTIERHAFQHDDDLGRLLADALSGNADQLMSGPCNDRVEPRTIA